MEYTARKLTLPPTPQIGQTHSNNSSAVGCCRRIILVCLTILWGWTNYFSVFDHFVGLAIKGLRNVIKTWKPNSCPCRLCKVYMEVVGRF